MKGMMKMENKTIKRIQFYTRKAKKYAMDKRPKHQRNRYRFNRLMQYKTALYARMQNAQ